MRQGHCWAHLRIAAYAVAFLISVTQLASGAEPKDLKAIAKVSFVGGIGPISVSKAETLVVRSIEELVAASAKGRQAKDPSAAQKDPDIQKEVEKQLATALKVEKIDWRTQMVVVVSTDLGSPYRATPIVELVSLKVSGEKLILTMANDKKQYSEYGQYPGIVVLVERHDGKAEVEWKRGK